MIVKKLSTFLRIQSDLDNMDAIHAAITNAIIFKGTNLWILVFAIVIASVGLNMNSTAVIIGAMLISPLMGPINGMGYSIATYDFPLFRRALRNFAFAVSASLAASTAYFAITPLSIAHSELLARTSPSIYDVIIALFGGLAGIVAISSKHKGNVIPGVAIATALMPPLCTAGYGLATFQFAYFFGAFYLFTINTVFIAISSVLFSQFLDFPIRTVVEEEKKRKVHRWTTAVIAITVIPSLYFGYLLVQKERFTVNANKLIASISALDGNYLLRYDVNPGSNSIKLIYGGVSLRQSTKDTIQRRADRYDLTHAQLEIEQGFSTSEISHDITEVDQSLRAEIGRLALALQRSRDERINAEIGNIQTRQVLLELKALYPQVVSLAYANPIQYTGQAPSDSSRISVVVMSTRRPHLRSAEKQRIESWIRQRISAQHIKTFYEQE
ncbi:DUF389 domain-containing protein [Fulvivirgaceae bacterium PWU5]|uniref:DUF389 domain-containing protein n=2 Tax=Dawidia cretensis TaxID=2782350 RepID=A0AAP2GTL8_9BACT|nr:DUF389 domain-containing protein [Dawidia cretensis]MBT1708403.1 DUF389 domain-containing protein [Dawidia cretensis]